MDEEQASLPALGEEGLGAMKISTKALRQEQAGCGCSWEASVAGREPGGRRQGTRK